jgi:hypothetical protein
MSARFLAWYTSVLLAFGSVVASAITVEPGGEGEIRTIMAVLAGAAGVFAVVGVVLCSLPRDHRANRSKTVQSVLSGVALVATLMVFAVVG